MEYAVIGFMSLVLTAQGAIWYKLGRVEARVNEHLHKWDGKRDS